MTKKEIIEKYLDWLKSNKRSFETDNLIGNLVGWPKDYAKMLKILDDIYSLSFEPKGIVVGDSGYDKGPMSIYRSLQALVTIFVLIFLIVMLIVMVSVTY